MNSRVSLPYFFYSQLNKASLQRIIFFYLPIITNFPSNVFIKTIDLSLSLSEDNITSSLPSIMRHIRM